MTEQLSFTKNEHFFRHEQTIKILFRQAQFSEKCSFFSYLKCYRSGECILFTTNAAVYEMLAENKFHFTVPFPEEIIKQRFYYFIQSDSKFSDVIYKAKQFKVNYPFDSVHVYKDYYELFCYGFYKDDPNIYNYLLNNQDLIIDFENTFRNNIIPLVDENKNNTLWLPKIYRTNIFSASAQPTTFYHKDKYFKNKRLTNFDLKLSRQQIVLLDKLASGYTIEESAKLMTLSHRTAESYLNIIKIKLNCKNKKEVIRRYIEINQFLDR